MNFRYSFSKGGVKKSLTRRAMGKSWPVLCGEEGNPINLINCLNIFEDEN